MTGSRELQVYYYLFISSILILQKASIVEGACFQLTNSKTCTDLAGSWIMPSAQFTDVPSFDAYILSSLESSPAYVQQFDTAYGCPSFNGSLRYHASVLCNYLVSYAASQCQQGTTPTPLCQSTCAAFMASLNQTFNNASQCAPITATTTDPNQQTQLNLRTNELKNGSFAYYCQVLPNSQPPTCSQGLAQDIATCGFVNASYLQSYCLTNLDPCCAAQAALMLVVMVADPNTLYLLVLASVGGFTVFIILYQLYASYELKIRAKNTTAVFLNPSSKNGRAKSVIAIDRNSVQPVPLDPKISPGYNNPAGTGRKFTVARASVMPDTTPSNYYLTHAMNASATRTIPRVDKTRGEEWRCLETFLPRLRDEMDVERGDSVVVEEVFDDGWAYGTNTRSGRNGVFPLALLERVADSLSRPKKPYQTRQPRQSSLPRGPYI